VVIADGAVGRAARRHLEIVRGLHVRDVGSPRADRIDAKSPSPGRVDVRATDTPVQATLTQCVTRRSELVASRWAMIGCRRRSQRREKADAVGESTVVMVDDPVHAAQAATFRSCW
jgi:hypothetical protein